jgi:hypothetical protein
MLLGGFAGVVGMGLSTIAILYELVIISPFSHSDVFLTVLNSFSLDITSNLHMSLLVIFFLYFNEPEFVILDKSQNLTVFKEDITSVLRNNILLAQDGFRGRTVRPLSQRFAGRRDNLNLENRRLYPQVFEERINVRNSRDFDNRHLQHSGLSEKGFQQFILKEGFINNNDNNKLLKKINPINLLQEAQKSLNRVENNNRLSTELVSRPIKLHELVPNP